MDWASPREDAADTLLNDLSSRPPAPSTEFSPLVSGLLGAASGATGTADWAMPHVARNGRNDFRYEFSLSAGPEFDTESADGGDDDQEVHDEDNMSTDLNHGTSTSEDTSLGIDGSVSSGKNQFAERDNDMSAKRDSPGMSPLTGEGGATGTADDDKGNQKSSTDPFASPHSKDDPESKSGFASRGASGQKPSKGIQKKKSSTAAKKPTASGGSVMVSGGTSAVQSGTLSHTKMCRDRLNNMFERLRHTLPPAPAGVEVKHKAQVLDYAIAVLKGMVDRTSQLEIELAVSSNKATMDWISKLVGRVDSFPEAAEEAMRLFSRRRGWMHSELWVAGKRPAGKDADPEEAIILNFGIAVPNDTMGRDAAILEQFSKESESYAFKPKEGVQGRVWASMRPEWVTGLSDSKNFRRSALARKYGLKVCLAVPVTITGKIEAVMCFYDVKHRPYDPQCLELAMRLAWALGNAVGGKRAKVNVLTASGTSNT